VRLERVLKMLSVRCASQFVESADHGNDFSNTL